MPDKKGFVFELHQWVTLVSAVMILGGGLFTVYNAKADKAVVEEQFLRIKADYRLQISELKKDIQKQRLEEYNDKLHILNAKRDKTHEDHSAIQYYRDRKDALILEINRDG